MQFFLNIILNTTNFAQNTDANIFRNIITISNNQPGGKKDHADCHHQDVRSPPSRLLSSEPGWECFCVNLDENENIDGNAFEIEIKVLQRNFQSEKLA